jgi:hypothetical protein
MATTTARSTAPTAEPITRRHGAVAISPVWHASAAPPRREHGDTLVRVELSPVARIRTGLTRATREAYRRELVPERMLWWLAADGMRDWFRALAKRRERWEEVATHLGELLVVLTEDLPGHLPHARKILGDICFDAGARYAERVKTALGIPDDAPDPRKVAMEILRMSCAIPHAALNARYLAPLPCA